MEFSAINHALSLGEINTPGLFPHLDALENAPFVFQMDFGLSVLPEEPGVLLIRGARQYGKSTWLESALKTTIQTYGAGSAFYLNGDELLSADKLQQAIEMLLPAFSIHTRIKRIFIDEITAIPHWEIALKRLADQGKINAILLVTTGSSASDLRRGTERLPGRKGKLARTDYLFTPIAFKEFHRLCGEILKEDTLIAYLLSGGSPIACTELALHRMIPEYVMTLTRDWIEGELARANRQRLPLYNIIQLLYRYGGTPVAQAKLAREADLANNTVAMGYIHVLQDLGIVIPAYPWDAHKKTMILRKPCKYHFTNLLAALTYHPHRIRSIDDFHALENKSVWFEWLIAQELMRRDAIEGKVLLMPQAFFQNNSHEIDFVTTAEMFIEVKSGKTLPLEFAWFAHLFPDKKLTIVNRSHYENNYAKAISFEAFLLDTDS